MRYVHTSKAPKLEQACSSDQSRPVLASAYLNVDLAELQATDSYAAVRMPVAVETDEVSGFVSPEALKASRKRDAGGLHVNGSVDVMPAYWDGTGDPAPIVSYPREERGQFPNLPQLWFTGTPRFRVGLNAQILKRLADALGADDGGIVLEFQPDKDDPNEPATLRPMLVRPLKSTSRADSPAGAVSSPEGLIMPIRVSS